MGGVWKILPLTYSLMIIGTLALTGFPLLSGFYSKDAIIEFAYLHGTSVGYMAAIVGILTAFLTSIYSWRLIFKTFHGKYNNKDIEINKIHESPYVMTVPLIVLAIGSIVVGFVFKNLFLDFDNFWKNSIFLLNPLSQEHPPFWFLILTPTLVTLSIPISYLIFIKYSKVSDYLAESNKPLYLFLKNKWYFDEVYEYSIINPCKKIGSYFWRGVDGLVIDKFGPDGISKLIKIFSLKAVKFQSGYIYQYAFIMLLGFSLILTILIIN